MKNILLACGLLFLSLAARAELSIQISQGVDNPTAIAVVPFRWAGKGSLPENVSAIVGADLRRSGLFYTMPKEDMLSLPAERKEVYFRDWRIQGMEYVLIGRLSPEGSGYSLGYELFDVVGGRSVINKNINGGATQLRDLAHAVSDDVYQAITGIPGAFSTRIVYVSEDKFPNGKPRYRLMLSDSDGARERLLLESRSPLMSPTWSPDGKQIAYVSFETGRASIWRQEIATARREQLTNFKGLNNSPNWSPDGRSLALVLSKAGSPDIYVLDIASRSMRRITHDWSIETEPEWSPDGKSLFFTSDRGSKPQIYKYTLATGAVKRVTFQGDYNARPRVTPDGKTLVFVHRYQGVFHIATQDLQTGLVRVLTETRLDESPTLAPNGAMLLYATFQGEKGILAAVSLDAGVKYRLPAQKGSVREPAWSPYRR
ncbi:MAG: Tol-Pal system beta propeller repeat protein TolB [Cellvibrionaceae bacterium]